MGIHGNQQYFSHYSQFHGPSVLSEDTKLDKIPSTLGIIRVLRQKAYYMLWVQERPIISQKKLANIRTFVYVLSLFSKSLRFLWKNSAFHPLSPRGFGSNCPNSARVVREEYFCAMVSHDAIQAHTCSFLPLIAGCPAPRSKPETGLISGCAAQTPDNSARSGPNPVTYSVPAFYLRHSITLTGEAVIEIQSRSPVRVIQIKRKSL